MKASVFYADHDIRYEENYPDPVTKPNEVKIAVEWCGICGSDLHEYEHGPMTIPEEKAGQLIMGHEFSGVICEVGSEVEGFKVGDRVTANPFINCGKCHMCLNNRPLSCTNLWFYGLMENGAFAEYMTIPARNLVPLPDDVSFEEGALIEPLAVTTHAIHKSEVKTGQTVLVTGAGTIGLCAVLVAKAAGCTVFCSEVATARREKAKECGADYVFNPAEEDVVAKVQELTGGMGSHVSIDCAGHPLTIPTAVHATRNGGRIVLVGIQSAPFEFDFRDILYSEKEIYAIHGYKGDYSEFFEVVNLINLGKIDPSPVVTGKVGLKNIVEDGYEKLINDKENQVKIIASPKI
jgi:(R,R)-butanediol dehydrogenase/meso-butanediol dehydrogenase/diacetyl reductase